MRKTLTLVAIASIILISVSCQKEDLPVTSTSVNNGCPSSRTLSNGETRFSDVLADKKIQNAVACKACHAYKEGQDK